MFFLTMEDKEFSRNGKKIYFSLKSNQNFPCPLSNKIKCYKLKYCKGFGGFGSKILSHEERRRLSKEKY